MRRPFQSVPVKKGEQRKETSCQTLYLGVHSVLQGKK